MNIKITSAFKYDDGTFEVDVSALEPNKNKQEEFMDKLMDTGFNLINPKTNRYRHFYPFTSQAIDHDTICWMFTGYHLNVIVYNN